MEINLNFQTGSKSTKDKFDILSDIFLGKATQQQIEYYKAHLMTAEEKEIGKPVFEMNEEERIEYSVKSYNNSIGTLTDYDCKICRNKGDIMYYDKELKCEIYKPCKCRSVRKTIKKMQDSGLGNLLKIYKFSNYTTEEDWQKDIFEKAVNFVDSEDKWFAMLGESGSGKSHICTAISRKLLEQGKELKYMMWLDESVKLKQYVTNAEKYAELIKELKEAEVLYIDDFFKNDNETKPSPADIKLANEILNYRYNKARMDRSTRYVTLISTERTLEQLLEYDTALAGRIVEMTKPNNLIMITGSDKNYRLK